MIKDVFEQLNLAIEIQYNDKSLLYGLMALCEIPADIYSKVILVLDKAMKMKEVALLSELESIGVSKVTGTMLLDLLKREPDELLSEIKQNIVDIDILDGVERFEQLQGVLKDLELASIMKLNVGLARGLEVYTGTIWEVFAINSNVTSSIAAGGRYDKLISSFAGNDQAYPTVGMTFGLDVIYTVLKEQNQQQEWQDAYFLIPFPGYEVVTIRLASKLRAEGKVVIMEMKGMRVGKAMNLANKMKHRYVVVVGEGEVESGIAQVKNMEIGTGVSLAL